MPLADDDLRALSAPVPRYTSYPTAPHFTPEVKRTAYANWLQAIQPQSRLSLYMHVPFCDTLCWFCGCTTKITRRYEPVREYLESLMAEIAAVSTLVPEDVRVSAMHWGGGSPTLLSPEDISALAAATRAVFRLEEKAEFAIEVDPRGLDAARITALADAGLTRVSIGVQDFDPLVQQTINRVQSFEETRFAVEGFRARGVASLNIDAIYGLPYQTRDRLMATLEQVLALQPDRIALFGYAHVPWAKKHQQMIDESNLPGIVERHRHAEDAAMFLMANGYQRIGIDHYALPGDAMAVAARNGSLRRNFQGYTVDPADALLGFGASAIGSLPQGYVQNQPASAAYMRAIAECGLATERGIALSEEDRLRRDVIEKLMCSLSFSRASLRQSGLPVDLCQAIYAEADALIAEDRFDFIEGTEEGFRVTEAGRPFLRTIAARFDTYLGDGKGRHAVAV